MKILIFIEPHKIRNNYLEYSLAANKLVNLYTNLAKYKNIQVDLFCNKILRTYLIVKNESHFINFINKKNLDRSVEQLNKSFKFTAKKSFENDKNFFNTYTEILNTINVNNYDYLIYWGYSEIIIRYLLNKKTILVNFELGSYRLFGRNLLKYNVKNNRLKNSLSKKKISFKISNKQSIGKPLIILIFLQLPDDLLLLKQKNYSNQINALEQIFKIFESIKTKEFIFKVHPNYKNNKYNFFETKSIIKFIYDKLKIPRIIYNANTENLIQSSDLTLSVSSSVKYESLQLGIPSFHLGYNYFIDDSKSDLEILRDFVFFYQKGMLDTFSLNYFIESHIDLNDKKDVEAKLKIIHGVTSYEIRSNKKKFLKGQKSKVMLPDLILLFFYKTSYRISNIFLQIKFYLWSFF